MGQILCQSFPKNSAPPNTFVLDFWPLDLQENTFLLFTATKFEVTCNSSHRRLILTNSQNTLLHFSIQYGCIFLLRLIFNIIASLCVSLSQRTSSQVSAFPGVSMCIYTHEVHLSICYLLFYSYSSFSPIIFWVHLERRPHLIHCWPLEPITLVQVFRKCLQN